MKFRSLVAFALFLTLATTHLGSAQEPTYDAPAVERTVRDIVVAMLDAARNRDWERLEPYFPVPGQWQDRNRRLVTAPEGERGGSIWYPDVQSEISTWRFVVHAIDSVSIAAPFTAGGMTGEWGAVFVWDSGGWTVKCERFAFGSGVSGAPPGCSMIEGAARRASVGPSN